MFFSFIGLDTAATAGEEAKNPTRDLPRAILLSLGIITLLYCLVALAAVGAMPWQEFGGTEASLAKVLTEMTPDRVVEILNEFYQRRWLGLPLPTRTTIAYSSFCVGHRARLGSAGTGFPGFAKRKPHLLPLSHR